MITAGKRNKQIVLQRKTQTTDDYGGIVDTWTTYATVWARVAPLKGRELIAAKAAQSEVTTRIEMLYRSGVIEDDRVVYGGKYYNISAVIDPEEKHEELQIMTTTGLNIG
jgi:SPP1 family predicted phage head-tail adaptor